MKDTFRARPFDPPLKQTNTPSRISSRLGDVGTPKHTSSLLQHVRFHAQPVPCSAKKTAVIELDRVGMGSGGRCGGKE